MQPKKTCNLQVFQVVNTICLILLFFPSNNIEQWLIARQRIGKQNNDASNENWKGREYKGIIKNMKSYS